ncbi:MULTISPECIES: hypothetical protein [unclassified Saccharopolyspora]|uniref:hypothetical protein n=1 Tax=unclassified Saccharopolyspora TaxID=2646250 RepID=UPI001CD222FB|nr:MULTISPECIES: hypothetical protein [unclassified Saccharopolyspora]MCA1185542.1 hypothetical protein [Saccharopolyspora sp. 6T]MCA1196015.1 hypothetical protein [Saccharopolyspora sp. 6V]MCA1228499.1 hypothetical protein [Saccharopolyspora sp. 6M]MCA1283065.1 hypothetical protein [Saccharopolyspora sp. 7B]
MARVFMASEQESVWHVVELRTGGARPIARCGHVIRGRVHRRLGRPERPRGMCDPCASDVNGREPRPTPEAA